MDDEFIVLMKRPGAEDVLWDHCPREAAKRMAAIAREKYPKASVTIRRHPSRSDVPHYLAKAGSPPPAPAAADSEHLGEVVLFMTTFFVCLALVVIFANLPRIWDALVEFFTTHPFLTEFMADNAVGLLISAAGIAVIRHYSPARRKP